MKHFEDLKKSYSRVLCLNLMNKKRSEHLLTENFESMLKRNTNSLDFVKYWFFDFHQACNGEKYENLEDLISKIEDVVVNFKFFAEQIKKEKNIFLFQEGVPRINCLDCLDRTNVVMTKIAALAFESIMKHMNVDLNLAFGDSLLKLIDLPSSTVKKCHPFISNFKNLWADNGDYLSIFYSGTGSTISNVTRHGKTGFMNMFDHGIKSIERFYINNFVDQFKQEGIEILLGQDNGEFYLNKFEKLYSKELEIKENEYVNIDPLNIYILTWNISGFKTSNFLDMIGLELFNFENNPAPDIMAVGLQEAVNLNLKTIVSNNDKVSLSWENVILANANKIDKYVIICQKDLNGCFIIVLVKDALKDRITKIDFDIIPLGLVGKLGNKGAVLIKISVDDTSLCFINCHLQAGSKNNKERAENINTIHLKAFRKIVRKFK